MTNPQTTKKKMIKGWIGHRSWFVDPLSTTCNFSGQQSGGIYKTKNDAILSGWDKPARVELTMRLL